MAGEKDFFACALDEFLPQAQLPRPAATPSDASLGSPWTVILTGSTGSLGTYILATLQQLPRDKVAKVYCLNRSKDGREKQNAALSLRGIPPLQDDRFIFLEAKYDSPRFGLGTEIFDQLLAEVTVVIHNAWPVNFVLPGNHFRPSLIGLRNFLRFSHDSTHHPPLLFVSSLGVAYSSDQRDAEPFAERIHKGLTIPEGYAQSKYIAELMIDAYAASTGLPAAILRVGQIAGPVRYAGVWPAREWFPTVLRASRQLGVLPRNLGTQNRLDWVPVDLLSDIIVEIAEHVVSLSNRDASSPMVFNLTNPQTAPFDAVLPLLLSRIAPKTVPAHEWADLLGEGVARQPKMPGAKLVEFYKQAFMPSNPSVLAATNNLRAASKTACDLPPVNERWMGLWLDQWGYSISPSPSRL